MWGKKFMRPPHLNQQARSGGMHCFEEGIGRRIAIGK
jgi:hypothetical protein